MAKAKVVKPFTLTRDDGSQQTFEVGHHDLSDGDAKHWYVQAHLDPTVASATAAEAAKARADQEAIDAERKAAADAEAGQAVAAADAQAESKANAEQAAKAAAVDQKPATDSSNKNSKS